MSLTASSLITAAKQRTIGWRGRQKISNAMLLEELSFQDQLLTQMASQIAPELLATVTGQVTFTDAGNTNGYTLQSGIHYRDFVHIDSADDEYTPVRLVSRSDRDKLPAPPAGMLRYGSQAAVFYPVDPQGERWQTSGDRNWFEPAESHTMSYSYVPLPGTITSLSDTLTAPDMAREVIVESLVLTILTSVMGSLPRDMQEPLQARIQAASQKRQGALDAYRMQLYKFQHPQGQDGAVRRGQKSDEAWVHEQVSG